MPKYNASNTLITEGGCWGDVCVCWAQLEGRIYIVGIYVHCHTEKVHWIMAMLFKLWFLGALFTRVYVLAWHMCDHLSPLASWAHSTVRHMDPRGIIKKQQKQTGSISCTDIIACLCRLIGDILPVIMCDLLSKRWLCHKDWWQISY